MSFPAGLRVWVQLDGENGMEWWPAKVIVPEMEGVERDGAEGTVYVKWYGEHSCSAIPAESASNLVRFDDNPQFRQTNNSTVRAAIGLADKDDQAIRIAPEKKKEAPRQAAQAKVEATKKPRAQASQAKPQKVMENATASTNLGGSDDVQRGDPEMLQLKSDLEEALQRRDIPSARRVLLKFSHTQTDFRQLQATRVGVTVSSILSRKEFTELYGLCRIIVRFWAQSLPDVAKSALRSIAAARAHPEKPQTRAGQPELVEDAPHRVRGNFSQTLRDVLSMDGDASAISSVEEVASALEAAANTRDLRVLLTDTLSKVDHRKLRARLLSGELSAAAFFQLPPSELKTDAERAAEAAHFAKLLADKEASEQSMLQFTTLFECVKCGKSKCTFYEQQTRGGDEPMTQFVTCHECGHQFQRGGYE